MTARLKAPQVAIAATLELGSDRRTGDFRVVVSSRSPRVNGRELLVCAVLRDDRVVTQVGSGENANKSLTARYPARATSFEYVTLDGKTGAKLKFSFRLDPDWKPERLGVVVFVQDRKSGEIHQSAFVPWGEPRADEPATGKGVSRQR